MIKIILSLFLGFCIGRYFGWRSAHFTIARECKTLGGFYVNEEVYTCQLKAKPPTPLPNLNNE